MDMIIFYAIAISGQVRSGQVRSGTGLNWTGKRVWFCLVWYGALGIEGITMLDGWGFHYFSRYGLG